MTISDMLVGLAAANFILCIAAMSIAAMLEMVGQ